MAPSTPARRSVRNGGARKKVSVKGADELIVQADVPQPAEVERLYRRVRHDSGVWWPMATR